MARASLDPLYRSAVRVEAVVNHVGADFKWASALGTARHFASSAAGSATPQAFMDMQANVKLGDDVLEGGTIQIAAQQTYGMLPRLKHCAGRGLRHG